MAKGKKEIATKKTALAKNVEPLDFIDTDVSIISENQKMDIFMSKFMEHVDPFITYKKYFDTSAKSEAHILADVKQYYKQCVLNGSWSERKYVDIIDEIFRKRVMLSILTLDRFGLEYDRKRTRRRNRNGG